MMFELQLKDSHIEHALRALEENRFRFPRSNLKFEFLCNGCYYETYVDNSSRLKLDALLEDYELQSGDSLRFNKIGEGTQWEIRLVRRGSLLPAATREKKTRIRNWREAKTLNEDEIIALLNSLAKYYDMIPENEIQSEGHSYPMIWKRITQGYPVWVFEILNETRLDSALVDLEFARNTWNSEIMIIVRRLEDFELLHRKLEESFHSLKRKTSIVLSWDLVGLFEANEKYHYVDSKLSR